MTEYGPDCALIVVDVQNDFADPQGSLYVPGGHDVVPAANREIERARAAGAPVFYTQDWHPDSTPHFAKDGGTWPVHCIAESWGAEFHPGLDIAGEVVRKGAGGEDGYSGFTVRDPRGGGEHDTMLGRLLDERGVTRAVVIGLATDYCVKETALDALARGYSVTVLADAVRAVELAPGDGERALEAVRARGGTVA